MVKIASSKSTPLVPSPESVCRIEIVDSMDGTKNSTPISAPIISDSSHPSPPIEGSDISREELEVLSDNAPISPEIVETDSDPGEDVSLLKMKFDEPLFSLPLRPLVQSDQRPQKSVLPYQLPHI